MDTKVTYIPKKDIITYDYDAQSRDILYQRIDGIVKLFKYRNSNATNTYKKANEKQYIKSISCKGI